MLYSGFTAGSPESDRSRNSRWRPKNLGEILDPGPQAAAELCNVGNVIEGRLGTGSTAGGQDILDRVAGSLRRQGG